MLMLRLQNMKKTHSERRKHSMTDADRKKTRYIRIASAAAIAGNAVLAALKISAGIYSDSTALIGDGIDSSADVLISIITLITARIISKPADAEHPWGHGRAETVATAFLSFVIFLGGAQIIISSVSGFFSADSSSVPSSAAVTAAVISIAGKGLLAWSQRTLGKRADSAMIRANAKNMASDVLISLGVLAGLALSAVSGSAYADKIIAVLIGLWIIKTAAGIFMETNLELMDGSSDMEPYKIIVDAVNSIEGASNPHRVRIRRISGLLDIDLDIDVDPHISVHQAHGIASQAEHEIRLRLENVYDIVIHIEPEGDSADEVYGLSEREIFGSESD